MPSMYTTHIGARHSGALALGVVEGACVGVHAPVARPVTPVEREETVEVNCFQNIF